MQTPESPTRWAEASNIEVERLSQEEAARLTELLKISKENLTPEQALELEILTIMEKWLTREEAEYFINPSNLELSGEMSKRQNFLFNVVNGLTRKEAARLADLNYKKIEDLTDLENWERRRLNTLLLQWRLEWEKSFKREMVRWGMSESVANKVFELLGKLPEERTEDDWVTLRELYIKLYSKK